MKTQTTENNMAAAEELLRNLTGEMVKQWQKCQQTEQKLAEQQGKVLFADALSGSEGSIGVQEMAHLLYQSGIDIGEIRLYQWLRGKGYVYRQPCGQNMPSQKGLEAGLVELHKYVRINADGCCSAGRKLMITPKGQRYLLQVFRELKQDVKQNLPTEAVS